MVVENERHRDQEPGLRSENPCQFLQHDPRIRNVLEYFGADRRVERSIPKGQPLAQVCPDGHRRRERIYSDHSATVWRLILSSSDVDHKSRKPRSVEYDPPIQGHAARRPEPASSAQVSPARHRATGAIATQPGLSKLRWQRQA